MIQALAFALTLLLELPSAAAYRRLRRLEVPLGRLLIVSAAGTTLTHPFVWLIVRNWLDAWPYWWRIAVAEPFAVIVEALVLVLLTSLRGREALALAFTINLVSFALGYALKDVLFATARFIHDL